jgi:hypothetical protein
MRSAGATGWNRVSCDGCNKTGFTGNRNKCKSCKNFDLCDGCFINAKDIHNSQHEFESIKHPLKVKEDTLLKELKEMGFQGNEEDLRSLLRRFNFNLIPVVDFLTAV